MTNESKNLFIFEHKYSRNTRRKGGDERKKRGDERKKKERKRTQGQMENQFK